MDNRKRTEIGLSRGDKIFNAVNNLLLLAILLIVLLPLLNVFSSSISDGNAVTAGKVWFWPVGFSVEAYKKIFEYSAIWTGYKNTILYTIFGTAYSVAVTLLAAYPLSRRDFSFRNIYMGLFVFAMIFSGGLIPFYLTVLKLGMINTFAAMIIPYGMSIYNVIIARTFFENTLGHEILEAAQIDGCNDFRFFFTMALPLSGAIIAVIALFYAVGKWNSYFDALLFVRDAQRQPLQIILRRILVQNNVDQQLVNFSGASSEAELAKFRNMVKYGLIVVSSVPVLCVYPFVQKYFVKGVMIGSVKG